MALINDIFVLWVIFSAATSIILTMIGYFFIKNDLDGIVFAQIGGWTAVFFLRKIIIAYLSTVP